jgi:hypothetical protein
LPQDVVVDELFDRKIDAAVPHNKNEIMQRSMLPWIWSAPTAATATCLLPKEWSR